MTLEEIQQRKQLMFPQVWDETRGVWCIYRNTSMDFEWRTPRCRHDMTKVCRKVLCHTPEVAETQTPITADDVYDVIVDARVSQAETRWTLRGFAVIWGAPSIIQKQDMYGKYACREEVRPAAFAAQLAEAGEICCYRNHETDRPFPLGRRSNGSFRTEENPVGLWTELDVDDKCAELLKKAVGWSIGHVINLDGIEDAPDKTARIIHKGRLTEISVICTPAEPAYRTTIELVSVDPAIALARRRCAVVGLLGPEYRTMRFVEDLILVLRAELDLSE